MPAARRARHLRRAIGEHLGDVRRPLERVVVDANELVVPCDAEILLDEVDVLLDREPIRRRRVLGRRARRAAVRDRLFGSLAVDSGDAEGHGTREQRKSDPGVNHDRPDYSDYRIANQFKFAIDPVAPLVSITTHTTCWPAGSVTPVFVIVCHACHPPVFGAVIAPLTFTPSTST